MENAIKMLVKRLLEKGLSEEEISSCISSIWSVILDQNVKSCEDLNFQMQEHGWLNLELDEQAFKIASSAFTN